MKVAENRKELFFHLLRRAVGTIGSYDPNECLFMVEEELTIDEFYAAEAFLKWCVENSRTFGHNLPEVFAEFEEASQ